MYVHVCLCCLRAGFTGQQLSGGSAAGLPSEDSVLPLTINSSHQENEEEEFRRLLYVPKGRLLVYALHVRTPPPAAA